MQAVECFVGSFSSSSLSVHITKDIFHAANHSILLSKDTHRETAPSQKTQALSKNLNIEIWVIVAWKKPCIRGSYSLIWFSKN